MLDHDWDFGKKPRNLRPTFYLALLMDELGLIAKAAIEGDSESYRAELVALAAVAVAAIDEFDNGSAIKNLEDLYPNAIDIYPNGLQRQPFKSNPQD